MTRYVAFLRGVSPANASMPQLKECFEQAGFGNVRTLYTFYTPTPKGPVFMQLLERHFGGDITTRTWDTVRKCAQA